VVWNAKQDLLKLSLDSEAEKSTGLIRGLEWQRWSSRLAVSELSGNEPSLFSDEESHLAWAYFEFRPARCEYRVGGPLHRHGNSRLCILQGGYSDLSRTSNEYALVPGIVASQAPRLGVVSR
jgi:hypothetical protein